MARSPRWLLRLVVIVVVGVVGCGQVPPAASPAAVSVPAIGSPSASASPTVARSAPAGSPVAASVAEVYARAARALDRPGQLYHATIQVEVEDRATRYAITTELWVDARRGLARQEDEFRLRGPLPPDAPAPPPARSTTIATARGRYAGNPDGQVGATTMVTCHGGPWPPPLCSAAPPGSPPR